MDSKVAIERRYKSLKNYRLDALQKRFRMTEQAGPNIIKKTKLLIYTNPNHFLFNQLWSYDVVLVLNLVEIVVEMMRQPTYQKRRRRRT